MNLDRTFFVFACLFCAAALGGPFILGVMNTGSSGGGLLILFGLGGAAMAMMLLKAVVVESTRGEIKNEESINRNSELNSAAYRRKSRVELILGILGKAESELSREEAEWLSLEMEYYDAKDLVLSHHAKNRAKKAMNALRSEKIKNLCFIYGLHNGVPAPEKVQRDFDFSLRGKHRWIRVLLGKVDCEEFVDSHFLKEELDWIDAYLAWRRTDGYPYRLLEMGSKGRSAAERLLDERKNLEKKELEAWQVLLIARNNAGIPILNEELLVEARETSARKTSF